MRHQACNLTCDYPCNYAGDQAVHQANHAGCRHCLQTVRVLTT